MNYSSIVKKLYKDIIFKYFFIFLSIIIIIEILIMIFLYFLDLNSPWIEAPVDAFFLAIFSYPILIYYIIKPFSKELEFNQNYLQGIIDAAPNIMIVTNGNNIIKANRTMLKFTGFNTLQAFKQKHDCICDFFIKDSNCLMSIVQGVDWLEFILSKPTDTHEVSMMYNDKQHRFIVQAKTLDSKETNH